MDNLNACPNCGAHVPDVFPLHHPGGTGFEAASISKAECACRALLIRSVTLGTPYSIDPRSTRIREHDRAVAARRAA